MCKKGISLKTRTSIFINATPLFKKTFFSLLVRIVVVDNESRITYEKSYWYIELPKLLFEIKRERQDKWFTTSRHGLSKSTITDSKA